MRTLHDLLDAAYETVRAHSGEKDIQYLYAGVPAQWLGGGLEKLTLEARYHWKSQHLQRVTVSVDEQPQDRPFDREELSTLTGWVTRPSMISLTASKPGITDTGREFDMTLFRHALLQHGTLYAKGPISGDEIHMVPTPKGYGAVEYGELAGMFGLRIKEDEPARFFKAARKLYEGTIEDALEWCSSRGLSSSVHLFDHKGRRMHLFDTNMGTRVTPMAGHRKSFSLKQEVSLTASPDEYIPPEDIHGMQGRVKEYTGTNPGSMPFLILAYGVVDLSRPGRPGGHVDSVRGRIQQFMGVWSPQTITHRETMPVSYAHTKAAPYRLK